MTTDHDEIRRWAEKRTHQGGDVGSIRVMFPNAAQSEHDAVEEISWDEFFRQFDESKLAPLHDPGGRFGKLVGRDTAERREHGDDGASRHDR